MTSIVIPSSRSSWKLSRRNAYSNGLPNAREAARAFRCGGGLQLLDDLFQRARGGLHADGALRAAQAPIPLAVSRKVERIDRHVLLLDVEPHVELGPVEEWMNPRVRRALLLRDKVPDLRR